MGYKLPNKIISIIVGALLILDCGLLHAQEAPTATILAQNQPAPYSGLLLTKEAAAQIVAQTEQKINLEKAQCKLQLGELQARMQKDIDTCGVDLRAQIVGLEKNKSDLSIALEQANKSKWTWSIIAATVGIISGGITVKLLWK